MVRVALELVPTLGGMFGSYTFQGDIEWSGYSDPEQSRSPQRYDLPSNSQALDQ